MPVLQNPRHEKYAHLVASGIGQAEAYASIGYSANGADQGASRLSRRADVRTRVTELQTAAQKHAVESCALSRAWVIEQLMDNVRRAKQAIAVTNAKGEPTGEYRWDGGVANRALE